MARYGIYIKVEGAQCRKCKKKYTIEEFSKMPECTNCYQSPMEDFKILLSKKVTYE